MLHLLCPARGSASSYSIPILFARASYHTATYPVVSSSVRIPSLFRSEALRIRRQRSGYNPRHVALCNPRSLRYPVGASPCECRPPSHQLHPPISGAPMPACDKQIHADNRNALTNAILAPASHFLQSPQISQPPLSRCTHLVESRAPRAFGERSNPHKPCLRLRFRAMLSCSHCSQHPLQYLARTCIRRRCYGWPPQTLPRQPTMRRPLV